MRGETDGIVVLLRAEPDRARASLFEHFDERRDARILRVVGFTNQRIGGALKQVRIGMRESGKFTAGHWVPTKKDGPRLIEQLQSSLVDAHLRAAHIGDQRVWRGVVRDFWKNIESISDGQSNIDQVRAPYSGFKRFEECLVNNATLARFQNDLRAVPANDGDFGDVFAKRACERSANKARAENGYAFDEMRHGSDEMAVNCRRDNAEFAHQLREFARREGLRTIGEGVVGIVVHLNQ